MTQSSIDVKRYRILAVDDEPENLQVLRFQFRDDFDLSFAGGPEEALKKLSQEDFAVILTDQKMPKKTGLELLHEAHRQKPRTVGVIVSAYSDLEVILDALNSGAVYRYILKPWKREELYGVLKGAIERYAISEENNRLVSRLKDLNAYFDSEEKGRGEPVGLASGLKTAGGRARQVAPTHATVLLLGESGTGKEVFARFIHEQSPRKENPFIRVNLAALSQNLVESELFGHKKGAFTDATGDRIGRFELAHTGTLFLDEIGELPLETQVKLLRVLQERKIERVGDARSIPVDTRLICATHRDLGALMAQGSFREDLYYRINVFPIQIPPLRERREDIPLLAENLLGRLQNRVRKYAALNEEAVKTLLGYHWPGNVRELENILERALIFSKGDTIDGALILSCLGDLDLLNKPPDLAQELLQTERRALLDAISRAQGSRTQAAELLGISRSTLYYRLRRVGLTGKLDEE